jgi:hypothetical protein
LPAFPLKGLVRKRLLRADLELYSPSIREKLDPGDRIHVVEHEFLYLAMRHVQDLKYLGTPGPTLRNLHPLSFGISRPNGPMIHILGMLARWTWGQWCCKPGYNNPELCALANAFLG